ncbi:MAG: hypothetical protein CM1200mP15_16200 [Dehalococcoidia bacterium]|nr:MAG: hypothetical protein CM1200mP15_16200 [Dehalococcoidia bacterium]
MQKFLIWEGMAKAAGYAKVFSFDNLEDLTTGLDEVFESEGPVFVHLRVEPEIENTPVQYRTRPSRTVQMAIKELPETLGVDRFLNDSAIAKITRLYWGD